MASYLARIATGPRLSKDLDRDQAARSMTAILQGDVSDVQAGVFLIALRMKRESHDELCGILDALRDKTLAAVADVDDLVDIAEPYNGYVRHRPATAFVPAVLAACGVPCVLHGCREIGPKFGVTSHRILAAAGAPVGHPPEQVARAVERAGWGYVDLSEFCPPLHALGRLRTLIVKRPCLSLLEKLLRPIVARGRNHLWVGYTHREYPEILHRLARESGYDSMLAVRGVEGGVITALSSSADSASYLAKQRDQLIRSTINPTALVGHTDSRAPELPTDIGGAKDTAPPKIPHGRDIGVVLPPESTVMAWAESAAQAGLRALAGEPGQTADMLVLSAAAVLRHVGLVADLEAGGLRAREAIRSGAAERQFAAFSAA